MVGWPLPRLFLLYLRVCFFEHQPIVMSNSCSVYPNVCCCLFTLLYLLLSKCSLLKYCTNINFFFLTSSLLTVKWRCQDVSGIANLLALKCWLFFFSSSNFPEELYSDLKTVSEDNVFPFSRPYNTITANSMWKAKLFHGHLQQQIRDTKQSIIAFHT